MTVPSIGSGSSQRMKQFLPKFAADVADNPFDVTAAIADNPRSVSEMAEILLSDPVIDSLMVIFAGSGELGKVRAQALADGTVSMRKPVVGVTLAGSSASPLQETLLASRIPFFHSASRAVEALAGLRHFSRSQASRTQGGSRPGPSPQFRERLSAALAQAGSAPTEYESKKLLAHFGIPIVEEKLAATVEEAVQYATAIGYPVALKVQSPQIPHKTEAGGVRLNLRDAEAVRGAYGEILRRVGESAPSASISGLLVSRMLAAPVEVIAGIHYDPVFGPVVIFGLGGIWVEVFGEASMRPAPLSSRDVSDMVDQLRGARLLRGARRMTPVRPEAIESLLLTLSDIALAGADRLSGIDINPLVPDAAGNLVALDASLYLKG